MKINFYLFCVSSFPFLFIQNSFGETTNPKSGFYITGKVGASVLQQKQQKYLERYQNYNYDTDTIYYQNNYGYLGGTHTNARLGGGIAVGYNFDNHFNIPIRAEIDVMARMSDSSNYLRDRQLLHYPWLEGKTDYENRINNKVQLNTFMVNTFYDFKNKSAFTPYIMAGVGLASLEHTSKPSVLYTDYDSANRITGYYKNNIKASHRTNNFAWNAGAGVRYKINNNFDLDISYRYLGAGKSSLTTWKQAPSVYFFRGYEKSKIKVVTQDIMLGLTYNF
ncbi:Opacity protein LomR and related surface antigens (LomR) (PDB:1Q9F) [Commensalibacter communis]|uniref:outer membrane protein n=1 Tax=Commensalibacter communis TaxID=2972786 RepID=UPI0022FF7128|nr:outer membrane beta-barrel protein [Commensalibacter communis]CAI3937018.1 Opacity protein LomR and related surface antigens (LomR) (PDB:1Q9F) [Commensalibacter communis]